ncbi:MAG: (Fe-S)-binding protein [Deltaproteobacteria bacterium]|nr:(Fe-S)-binding protein [Deltaproteobacteria bacterium]MBW2535555.1 (Fe-S)-binding protein [Deltaproteobacteria bacterium]
MSILIVGLLAAFAWSANRRWQLLKVGLPAARLDNLGQRLTGMIVYAFGQKRMPYYRWAGLAHMVIFFGFLILLTRSVILWGRGFDPDFNLWILGPAPFAGLPLGHLYEFAKDVAATAVLLAAFVFVYYRVVRKESRMTLSTEALIILIIIIVMMLADMMYDGAAQVLHARHAAAVCDGSDQVLCSRVTTIVAHLGPAAAQQQAIAYSAFPTPAGSVFAVLLASASPSTLVVLAHVGFWAHAALVLIFLNVLPHSKHFHVITAIPNVFLRDLNPAASVPMVGKDSEEIGEKVMKAFDEPETAPPVGLSRIEHFDWKAILDFYTCTECGRCSDRCPAFGTGKLLSPKQLTIDLRNHIYGREYEFLNRPGGPAGLLPEAEHHGEEHGDEEEEPEQAEAAAEDKDDEHEGHDDGHHEPEYPDNPEPDPDVKYEPVDLVPDTIKEEVLWGCTTCRACEEICPVFISYVDKIVGMRQNLVLVRGEFPQELAGPFQGIEVNGNPWNLARMDRDAWAKDLDVPTMADKPDAEVLYWVGCAASYDDRAKKIARATARLLKKAGVDFAILGQEETCVGDIARRAGNEYLFAMLAEQNVATINGYQEQGGVKKIITACPHCYNTLKNEYPAFGGNYEVVHHSELFAELVERGKLEPKKAVKARVAYHDACYLGRYNEVYDEPRQMLESIPSLQLVEAEDACRHKGLCCGAGGGQMFMEEQNKDRMNVRRTKQLLETGADTIASSCPFCLTMLTDGLKDQDKEEDVRQLDIAELLAESCGLADPKAAAKDDEAPEEDEG